MEKPTTQLLLRIPVDLKAALQKEADFQGRKLTQEINIRLRISLGAKGPTFQGILSREAESKGVITNPLPPSYHQAHSPTVNHTSENSPTTTTTITNTNTNNNGPVQAITDLDRAMLDVFHAMPVEKQLALLSLFK